MIAQLLRKEMRNTDGVAGDRARSLGIRAHHLRLAAANGFPRSGVTNAVRWAAATAALNQPRTAIGISDSIEIDLSRIITWKSIHPMASPRTREHGQPMDDLPSGPDQ